MVEQTILERINQRRRQLLVHSYLYYRQNTSAISDHQYDKFTQDLIKLQSEYPEIAEQGIYAEEFRGFSMGDSFALPLGEPYVQEMAMRFLRAKKEAYE
jgi:NAD-dependent DNA ligase